MTEILIEKSWKTQPMIGISVERTLATLPRCIKVVGGVLKSPDLEMTSDCP